MTQQNPFPWAGQWYWRDEKEVCHGPYASQVFALRKLLNHIVPPWYVRWWNNLKDFWNDARG